MTLLRRLTRLVKADIHGILDGLEEPEEVLKQTIRDMEEALAHKEQALATLANRLQRLRVEAQALEQTAQEIEQQIDLCFEAGNDTLARNFIRKRLVTQRQTQQLRRAMEEAHNRQETLTQTIAAQRQQLAAIVQQLNFYTTTHPASPTATPGQSDVGISDDEVEVAFLDEQRRRAGRTQTTSSPQERQ